MVSNPTKYKTYPAYRPSGIEWLDKIPAHWAVKHLKYAARINAGQSPPSAMVSQDLNALPFLQGNAEFGDICPTPKFTCQDAPKTCSVGDILLSVRAPVGALNIADQAYGIGRGLCAIHTSEELEGRFAYYLLCTVCSCLGEMATGSTYDAVTIGDVGKIPAILPPLAEQCAIAKFLDWETAKIDALVAKKERLIELLQEKRNALITSAVTHGLDPNVKMKESGVEWLGNVPSHWEVVAVKHKYDVQLGKMLQNNPIGADDVEVPYLKALNVQWFDVQTADPPTMWASQQEVNLFGIKKGDLLVCEGGEGGRSGIIGVDVSGYIIQNALHRVRPIRDSRNDYLQYVLSAITAVGWFDALNEKATIAHFTGLKFGALRIPLPPLPEQRDIAALLDREKAKLDSLINRVQDAIDRLRELRTALISAAVTGRIDVRQEAA